MGGKINSSGINIGYARVFTQDQTQDQNITLQRDALAGAGCGRVFEDTADGLSGLDSASEWTESQTAGTAPSRSGRRAWRGSTAWTGGASGPTCSSRF